MFNRILVSLFALAALTAGTAAHAQAPIVVGGKGFTEQQIMAQMTAKLLEAKGFKVDKRAGMGSTVLRAAQENGQVDVYWEYTGTSLVTYNKINDRLSPDETYRKVKELDANRGLVWLNPSKANNTYALAMNADEAKALGIATIEDLARVIKGGKAMTFACNSEFYARPDGLKPLQEKYGFEFARENVKRMDTGLTYQALKDHQVNVALVFATDGRIPAFRFVTLADNKGFFAPYAMTPVVRKAVLDANPKIADYLNALSAKLDDATMGRLNASVDVEKKSIEDVAEGFLKSSGMI